MEEGKKCKSIWKVSFMSEYLMDKEDKTFSGVKPFQNTSYPPIPADITSLQLTKASNTQHLKAEKSWETSGTNSPAELSRDVPCMATSCSSWLWLKSNAPAAMVKITSKRFFKYTLHTCTQWTYIKLIRQLKRNSQIIGWGFSTAASLGLVCLWSYLEKAIFPGRDNVLCFGLV